ncbi:MAG: SDR family oxidoreductase [Desulfobacterales bacterium]|nr:SDR family oxidoreductase [Desulfobacterales bacterium]
MLNIKDSVAVITGGASGIGFSMAQYWVEKGGKVVLADINPESLKIAKQKLKTNVATIECNVTKEKDCTKLADFAMETFGAINLVVPSAGIINDSLMLNIDRETGKVKSKMSLEQFTSVININLTGVFLTIRECMEKMINHDCEGLICLISSTGSLGTAGQINYSSTKAAVSVMPKVVTAELFRRKMAHKIRCVAIAPGYVRTPILEGMNKKALDYILNKIPINRLIEPEEIASLTGELFRNQALTGDVFFIHGGLRLDSKG